MTHLIVIDPGPSTGIAEFEGSELLEVTTTVDPHDELRARLRVLMRTKESLKVVCELGPQQRRHYADSCAAVEAIVREEATAIYWVRPSQWKDHPSATLGPDDEFDTRHERDAVRLGRYFIAQGGYTRYERIGTSSEA